MKEILDEKINTVNLNLTEDEVFVWGLFGLGGYTEDGQESKSRTENSVLNQEETKKGLAVETN